MTRSSRDLVSGEKRKIASVLSEECDDIYKRRKESSRNDSEKLKVVDSYSKSSRKHGNLIELKEENSKYIRESGEEKRSSSSKSDLKRKSENGRKRGSQSGYSEDEHQVKQEAKKSERDHELRHPDLEKELENRKKRRRDGSAENDKYQDEKRNDNYRGLSPRVDREKLGKDRDERSDRDKYRDKHREDINRDYRHHVDKKGDGRSSRNCMSDRSDTKHSRDDGKAADYRHSKSKPQDSDRDRTPRCDDQGDRYKDNKRNKGSSKETPSTIEYRSGVEKKTLSSSKSLTHADKGRSQPRHVDVDSTVSSSKWKASSSSSVHVSKDEYRNNSKQAEPRSGIVSSSVLSSSEDGRGKSSNRYRRNVDSDVGRGIGNAWNGVPNWPSPVTNDFISYPHGPPPGGFHPLIQPFPTHMFGVRPPMELNDSRMPYHISDADRFSGHGHSFGWQNPADGMYPPHMHGWDGSNGVFWDGSQMYGMPSWDQNRQLMSGPELEMSTKMWKGQNGMTMELPTASKDSHLQHVPAKEPCLRQSGGSRNDCEPPGSNAESIEVKPFSSRPLVNKSIVIEASVKATDSHEKIIQPSKLSHHNNTQFSHVYLSKLDISADLTDPKLYKQCLTVIGEGNTASHKDVAKLVNLEECTEAGVRITSNIASASLFPKINDSIFQKAMALYKKQADESFVKPYISSLSKSIPEMLPTVHGDKQEPTVMEEPILALNEKKAKELIPTSEHENIDEPLSISHQDKAEPTSNCEKAEEPIPTPGQDKAEVAVLASYQEKAEEEAISTYSHVVVEDTAASTLKQNVEGATSTHNQNVEGATSTHNDQHMEELIIGSVGSRLEDHVESGQSPNSSKEQHTEPFDAMSDIVGLPEGCEPLMPESIQSMSVNLSRIH